MGNPGLNSMISFIIPAFNEERLLGRTLKAIQKAAKEVDVDYELIVVDDNSSDNTAKIARDLGAAVVKVNHRKISATRNSGANAANGSVLIFIDADTVISNEILQSTMTAINNKAIGGTAAFRFDGYVPLYGRLIQWLLYCFYHLGKIVGGSYLFCTREAFVTVGGFDETVYGGEEMILSRSLKKLGPFIILKHTVLTSGRRLRIYSLGQIIRIITRLAFSGSRIEDRNAGWFWYDGKREN
jgi:glycosyltransferase involved in cell wall biosynthesis